MTIRVDDEVWAEVFAAASRYERERVSLGDEFVAAVDAALETIAANPEAWAVWPDIRQDDPPIRRYVMPRFPYLIGFPRHGDRDRVRRAPSRLLALERRVSKTSVGNWSAEQLRRYVLARGPRESSRVHS